ncbi:chloride channel protein [Nonlabens antarcticus]|uniref:chloride channel protein n=1 Tax=Nonlabens antarcticus TaxID=392714 RepID=UPI001890D611|nr:chloride channel protein [Nonlabens antarcticus]
MMYKIKKLYVSFLQFKKTFVNYPFRKFNVIEIFLFWVRERVNRSQFLIISGVLVGLTAGLAGVLLKVLVHHIQFFINNDVPFRERMFVYGLFPLVGILITTLIAKYFFKSDEDKELSFILKNISQNDSKMKSTKMYSQILQSAATVGFGGSVGLETPIAVTGSAIGSNFAQRYSLGFKERTLLLASGAAAGIAAAFNAPIAGVMFAFEILLVGLVFTDFIPLVIAAICGSLLSKIILDDEILFNLHSRDAFDYANTFYFIILGLLTGLYARYFIVVSQIVHTFFERFKKKILIRALVGGAVVSLLCVAFPPLFGEGYLNIHILHKDNAEQLIAQSLFRGFGNSQIIILVFLGLTVLLKAFATSITLSAGGNGGNFAPTLVAGGLLGYMFGFSLEMMGVSDVPTTNLMLVGMAGVMSGAMYAPLTGIFLIAETSSGYDLFIPLMIVSVIAYAVNRFFSPTNPAFDKLAAEGEIFTTQQDQNILSHLWLADCLNASPLIINIINHMDEVISAFRKSNQNTMAVVDSNGQFYGILNRDQLRPYLLGEKSTEATSVGDLLVSPSYTVESTDSMMKVIKMFDEADVWQLPLLDKERKFQGFVSRSMILNNYRRLLKDYSE